MRKRTDIVSMFSTFLNADDCQSFSVWKWGNPDPKLLNSMQRKIEEEPHLTEEYWAKWWLRKALENPNNSLAKWHIYAYLEESCYFAVMKIFQKYGHIELKPIDCLQVARDATYQIERFSKYNFADSSVKTYAQQIIFGVIRDKVIQGQELLKYTNLGLLRAVSKKKLEDSLKIVNTQEAEIQRFILAWQCFSEFYVPTQQTGSRSLQPPSLEQLENMARRYNSRNNHPHNSVNGAEIQRILDNCCDAVRDAVRNTRKVTIVQLDDSISEPSTEYQEEVAIEQEIIFSRKISKKCLKITNFLDNEFANLEDRSKTAIQLSYGLAFIQKEIASIVVAKQYQISRSKTKAEQKLLDNLLDWVQQEYQLTINSDKQIEHILSFQKMWLDSFCKKPLRNFLQNTLLAVLNQEIPLLKLVFGAELQGNQVAEKLNISMQEIDERINQLKSTLGAALKVWLQFTLKIDFAPIQGIAEQKITDFVEEWLKTINYETLEIDYIQDLKILEFLQDFFQE